MIKHMERRRVASIHRTAWRNCLVNSNGLYSGVPQAYDFVAYSGQIRLLPCFGSGAAPLRGPMTLFRESLKTISMAKFSETQGDEEPTKSRSCCSPTLIQCI